MVPSHLPIIVAIVLGGVVLLLIPAGLRRRWPEGTLTRAVDALAAVLCLPSRLLSAAHNGDVRMHLLMIVAGAVLLVVFVLTRSGLIG